MAAIKPDNLQKYIVWLRGVNGPGVAFATTFQRELKDAEQKLGPTAALDQGAAAMVWQDIARMTKFDVSNLDISDAAYLGDTDLWWNITGAPLVDRLVSARRKLSGSAGAWSKKEATGKVLSQAACTAVSGTDWWNQLMAAAYGGDLDACLALLSLDRREAGMVLQGVVNVTELYGVVVAKGDIEKLAVYNGIKEIDLLLQSAVKGAIESKMIAVTFARPVLVAAVRETLADTVDPVAMLEAGQIRGTI